MVTSPFLQNHAVQQLSVREALPAGVAANLLPIGSRCPTRRRAPKIATRPATSWGGELFAGAAGTVPRAVCAAGPAGAAGRFPSQ